MLLMKRLNCGGWSLRIVIDTEFVTLMPVANIERSLRDAQQALGGKLLGALLFEFGKVVCEVFNRFCPAASR